MDFMSKTSRKKVEARPPTECLCLVLYKPGHTSKRARPDTRTDARNNNASLYRGQKLFEQLNLPNEKSSDVRIARYATLDPALALQSLAS